MASKKKEEAQRSFAGLLIELIICAFCMLIGFLMLFVDSMKIEYFAYVIGGVLLALGIYLILNFFVRHGYKEITNYDFSGGVLVTAIGVVVLVNAKSFDVSFYIAIGVLLLVLAVMILQSTIQLMGMRGKAWWLNLIFALLILVYAILLLTKIKTGFSENETLYYSLVIASGGLGIFSIIITAIRSAYFKKEEAEKETKTDDHADYSVPEIQAKSSNYRQADIDADYEEIAEPKEIPEAKAEEMPEKKAKKNKLFGRNNAATDHSANVDPSASASASADICSVEAASDHAQSDSTAAGSELPTNEPQATNAKTGAAAADSSSAGTISDDSGFDEDELALLHKNDN